MKKSLVLYLVALTGGAALFFFLNHSVKAPGLCDICPDRSAPGKIVPESAHGQLLSCPDCHPLWYFPVSSLYQGRGGAGISPWPDPMAVAGIRCKGCHLLNPRSLLIPHEGIEIIGERCAGCHGDRRYRDLLLQWRAVLSERMHRVLGLLEKGLPPSWDKNREGGELIRNIKLLGEGRGIHNYAYAVLILERAEEALLGLLSGKALPTGPRASSKGDGVFSFSSSDSFPPALFNHRKHQKLLPDCRECHEKYFSMHFGSAEGSGVFTMENMGRGWFCGGCHDGKRAFSVKEGCKRCHKKN